VRILPENDSQVPLAFCLVDPWVTSMPIGKLQHQGENEEKWKMKKNSVYAKPRSKKESVP
jgi:hypothetical protein